MNGRYFPHKIRFRLYPIPQISGVIAENPYWTILERIAERYSRQHLRTPLHMHQSEGDDKIRGHYFEVNLSVRSGQKLPDKIFWISQ